MAPEDYFSPINIDVWNATLTRARTTPVGSAAHSRQNSLNRGLKPQTPEPFFQKPPNSTSNSNSNLSPRLLSGNARGGVSSTDVKNHNRSTSIVHGYQRSRNGSFASSSSPLSPQIIAAAGVDWPDASSLGDSPTSAPRMSSISSSTSFGSNATLLPDRASTAADNYSIASAQKRVQGSSSSSRSRRDHNHHPSSASRHHHKDESKTVGEYALHVLFTSFIAQAEEKISQCITSPLDPEPQIDFICGAGADPTFDQLISALGHIARQKPKPLIDAMMFWRKNKSDAANEARVQLQQSRGNLTPGQLARRNTEPPHAQQEALEGTVSPTIATRQELVAQAERRSTASIFILCRVLMEVIGQSTLACITPEMEDKLEGIIFGQLKIADMDHLHNSPLKLANWFLFSQLLGVMSEINFDSVTDRFIADLERTQDIVAKSQMSRETEGRMELVLGGMKHIHLKSYPEDAWDQSCDFMISLGKFFALSHGHRLKYAYCTALDGLLLPIAATASTELNMPKWNEVLATIGPRLASMFVKPRHWSVAFPLTATMLCVSPVEQFSTQWLQLVLPLQPKIKDPKSRPICLQVVSRLVWTYLYRTADTNTNTIKKLEEVLKLVLPPGRRTYLSTDPSICEPLVQIIRIIGFKHTEFCLRTMVFPLINADLFASGRDLKVEQLEPERMVIGIRAFLAIMSDLEKGEQGRPPFPQTYSPISLYERMPPSPITTAPRSPVTSSAEAHKGEERLSRPVLTNALSEVAKEYYAKFCEILGKITIICDNTFGGQAVLDEKFSSPAPKTPIADTFNFTRRDDHLGPSDQKQGFYELLHVAVQALPRCLSAHIPFNSLVNLLCTGTAHVQYNIAESSAQSLKSIARQHHAQQVTIGFARFIFNFDDRYATMSDGGMLGPGHIESTLKLYVELLQIWIEEIKYKTREAAADFPEDDSMAQRGAQLDQSGIWAHIDEVESHGLFFLCSQSRRVRSFAVTVLRLINEFDLALGQDNSRIIYVLERESALVMDFNDEQLSVAERSRLQRGMRKSNSKSALVELCSSEVSYDTTLWFKIFPKLVRRSHERCPLAVTLARELICNRILQMYKAIVALSEATRGPHSGAFDRFEPTSGRLLAKSSTTPPEVMIEQWKLYLIVACTTLSDKGGQQPTTSPQAVQHFRKGSKQNQTLERITSARSLFKYIIPLLSVGPTSIRDAVVVSLGSINVNIYKTLLEELQAGVSRCNDDARARIHQRTTSSPKRNRKMDLLRTEITHVYHLTSRFLAEAHVFRDDWILNNLVVYAKELKLFLNDTEVQQEWEFQKLRQHYCGLMKELFEGINRAPDTSRWMSFEFRKSSFSLMEDWCGFSPNQEQIRQKEDNMRQSMINQQSLGERGTVTAAMEIEKRNLRTAALSAMAALCAGPLVFQTESRSTLQFDVRRMISWIDTIFKKGSDRMQFHGRQALKNLIVHNKDLPFLLEHSIQQCYLAKEGKVLESYFSVLTDVLIEHPEYPLPFWRILGIGLYILGNEQSEMRSKSAHVLRALEERHQRSSKIQDFDISISDKTKAVYTLAQFEISKRLAANHSELAFLIFSEFTVYFKTLGSQNQRIMVAAILPWIQIVELQLDPNGGPTAQSYVLLTNLFEITIRCSNILHNEVQALWQALATGPHAGNVQLVLDFVMSLCLDRREQNFVEFAKQIVVFLSSTPAGVKVVEFLLMQITPKAMIPNEKRELLPPPPDASKMPYLAELSEALPTGARQAGLSLGQLSLILLVDLMVSPVQLVAENVPLLLQVVTVLWDHYIPTVQEQAREMLIHLIHELVISRIDDEQTPMKEPIEKFIESIRAHNPSVIWQYDDNNGKIDEHDSNVPPGMEFLTSEVVKDFQVTYPRIQDQWAKISLTWATSCPVRHLACRSFQIFRCILTTLDQSMLADMLARLSNTIADEDVDVQTFSMEILTTLRTLICKLEPDDLITFPQLFWTTCACLGTINEREFLESIGMLEELLLKLDLGDPKVRALLTDGRPPRWEGDFAGIQPLIYKGLRSSVCLDATLVTLSKLIQLPSDDLIGDNSRILFAILSNFPSFLHAMDQDSIDTECLNSASILAEVAELQGCNTISRALSGFAASRYRSSKDFLAQLVSAIRESFFPKWEFGSLTFLMGFLTNNTPWLKIKTMRILCVLIPDINMRKPEIASHGPDLISPLLRLLQTEFCMQALEVLDHIMTMTGTSMDKHHLRMSMTRSTSKAIRKEYERTQSLFGIPEDSGWSIPMPARHAETTRANVHAAFYTCQCSESLSYEVVQTPEVEFHVEDFQYGYFPPPDRTETMMSDDPRSDGNIGDLVMKLDSLDDFFDDHLTSPTSDGRSSRTITEAGFAGEDGAELYDEQTLPILHQSLTHTSNNSSSFQNGFADLRPSLSNAMTPGAFNLLNAPRTSHARSITSPSASSSSPSNVVYTSDDDFIEEVFSDGDGDDERVTMGEGSFFLENMIKPLSQGTRSGLRRLTGGRSRDSERMRDTLRMERRNVSQPPRSPRVPQVPSAFLLQQRPPTSPRESA